MLSSVFLPVWVLGIFCSMLSRIQCMTGLVLDRLIFVCAGQILPVTPAGVERLIYSCRGCMTHKSGGLNIAWLMIILIILHKLVKDRYLCMNVFFDSELIFYVSIFHLFMYFFLIIKSVFWLRILLIYICLWFGYIAIEIMLLNINELILLKMLEINGWISLWISFITNNIIIMFTIDHFI